MATTVLSKHVYAGSPEDVGAASGLRRISEWFWFLVSFLLFLVLGPFSAPVVLMVLARLGIEDNNCKEPRSIGIR